MTAIETEMQDRLGGPLQHTRDGAAATAGIPPNFRFSLGPVGDPATLGRRWRALEEHADASFFQSWSWIGTWLETLPVGTAPPLLAEAFEDDALVGLGILVPKRSALGGRRLTLHETGDPAIDTLTIEHNGFLIAQRHADTLPAAMIAAVLAATGAGELRLGGVGAAYAALPPPPGFTRLTRKAQESFVLGLGDDPEALLGSFGTNTRQQIRRAIRDFSRLGPLTLRAADDAAEAARFFAGLETLHRRQWEARGRTHAFSQPHFAVFHRRLIATALPRGEIRLCRIAAGGATVGFLYDLQHRGRIYAYQSGFDYALLPKSRPGLLCHWLSIAESTKAGATCYDFLGGENRLKAQLSSGRETLYWLAFRRDGAVLRAEQAIRRLKRTLVPVRRRGMKPADRLIRESETGAALRRQFETLLGELAPGTCVPEAVFPGRTPPRAVRLGQLGYGVVQLVSRGLKPGLVAVSGPELAQLDGDLEIDAAAPRRSLLRALLHRQACLLVPTRNAMPLSPLCRRLGFDESATLRGSLRGHWQVMVFGRSGGAPVIGHLARGRTGRETVRRQAAGLVAARGALAELGLGHLVAERIRSETRDGLAILVQQRLPGRTPAADDLSSSRLQERIALAMEPLEALHRRPRPPPARPDDRLVAVELPRAIASLPRYRSILEPTLTAVAAWLERRRLPAVLTHGDYWIGNLLFDDQGPTLTGIFDWEWFRPDGCTGLDALQLGCFSIAEWQKVKPPEIFGCVLEGTSVPDPLKAHIARVKTAFDLDDEDIGYLTLMLWLLRVYSNAYIHPASEAEVLTLVEQPAAAARRWLDRHRAGPVTGPVRERDGGAC